jgi:Zn-dependent membrane protease YugP
LLGFDHADLDQEEKAMFKLQDDLLKSGELAMTLINLLLIIGLLLFAGFLAGSESALTSLSRVLIEEIVESKPRYAKTFSSY